MGTQSPNPTRDFNSEPQPDPKWGLRAPTLPEFMRARSPNPTRHCNSEPEPDPTAEFRAQTRPERATRAQTRPEVGTQSPNPTRHGELAEPQPDPKWQHRAPARPDSRTQSPRKQNSEPQLIHELSPGIWWVGWGWGGMGEGVFRTP